MSTSQQSDAFTTNDPEVAATFAAMRLTELAVRVLPNWLTHEIASEYARVFAQVYAEIRRAQADARPGATTTPEVAQPAEAAPPATQVAQAPTEAVKPVADAVEAA